MSANIAKIEKEQGFSLLTKSPGRKYGKNRKNNKSNKI